ncbi:hypothetical protein Q9L58_008663 [Maublancomyces gigas]|uniref:Uncharacterized protein n=1 Tax=Discina gigas TaxID=1032678 RepID=A0ABR3G919_9PEZI
MRSFMRPGSLVQSFRPSTLRQITHLVVNGTGVDQEEIFLSNLLTGVKSVTITRMIKPEYRLIFAHLARQLTELIEIGDQPAEDGRTSSLTLLPAGTLNTIETLSLHAVQLPPLQTLLLGPFGVDVSLTRFTFLPSQTGSVSLTGNIPRTYIKDCLAALRILKEAAIFPSLKVVRLALGRSTDNDPMRKERVTLLNRIWAASAMHGGWRLLTRKPITDGNMGWITPWECGCETRNGALFLSVPEIESFAGFCDKINIYGRWDEFVVGDVHVDVQSTRSRYLELKNPRSETVRLADVHGVSILPGKDIDFGHVGSNTRCLSVQLRSFWDKRTNVEYNLNSNKFKNIEVLRLEILPVNQKQLATSHSRPPMYRNNIAAAITRNLHLPSWSSLRSLSLPAAAMQRFRENQDITKRAACCGRHIPEYHFPWLELCIQLDTLLITNWWTCLGCYEGKSNFQEEEDSQESPEDVDHSWTGGQSMVYALMESVPVRLTEFSMNAMFDEYDHPRWLRTVEKEIRGAFKPQVRVNYTHTVTRLPDRPWY